MKIFEINGKKIELNVGDELKVKDLRKIYPFLQMNGKGGEIEMMYNIVCSLSDDAGIGAVIDDMTTEEFTALGDWIGEIIDTKKK